MAEGATLGMCLLCLSHQLLFGERKKLSFTISAILILLTWLSLGSFWMSINPLTEKIFIAFIPLAFFLLLLLMFFYYQILVGKEENWTKKRIIIHIFPSVIASFLTISLSLMPYSDFKSMFWGYGSESIWININSIFFGSLLILWVALSIIYIINMVLISQKYHQRLSYSFSNFKGKTINWFTWFIALIIFTWIYSLITLTSPGEGINHIFNLTGVNLLVLLLVWFFSLNSTRHKPISIDVKAENPKELYSNSGLDTERLTRIATKIAESIQSNKMYLNANLTAAELAQHLNISAHYLSQAFTQHLDTTFYNYVNECRIQDAKQQLTESNDNVLEIALRVGFNSRSAFYNAFKRHTGLTPSAYRKSTR